MYNNEFGFCSAMKCLLTQYVHEKRLCGHQFASTSLLPLKAMDRIFLNVPRDQSCMELKAYTRLVTYRKGESGKTQVRRASAWRQFALFCRRQGLEAYVPSAHDLPIVHQDFCPYIYSRQELAALFDAIERLPFRKSTPRRIPDYRLLFRLLYGAGLRLGEALKLTIGDFDRRSDVLTIRQGKNQKDRLVPLTIGLAHRVGHHLDQYPGEHDTPMFLSPSGSHAIHGVTVDDAFRTRLLPLASLPPREKRQGPRIHDLRHTFAVHRLENWFLAGQDVEALLPSLSAYMGHTHVRDTHYYLRITASFFPEITRRLEQHTAGTTIKGGQL